MSPSGKVWNLNVPTPTFVGAVGGPGGRSTLTLRLATLAPVHASRTAPVRAGSTGGRGDLASAGDAIQIVVPMSTPSSERPAIRFVFTGASVTARPGEWGDHPLS